ncbi:hypothetical protein CLOM_g18156 [Closterium sp. NIES-68]|nr:hypothetical protein CLOM_g18156 [Closterium sp. NIES-68]
MSLVGNFSDEPILFIPIVGEQRRPASPAVVATGARAESWPRLHACRVIPAHARRSFPDSLMMLAQALPSLI